MTTDTITDLLRDRAEPETILALVRHLIESTDPAEDEWSETIYDIAAAVGVEVGAALDQEGV